MEKAMPSIAVPNLPSLELVREYPLVVSGGVKATFRVCRRWDKQGDSKWWRYYIGVPRKMIDPVPNLKALAETTPYWGITKNRFPDDIMEGQDEEFYYYIAPIVQEENKPIPEEKLGSLVQFFFRQGRMVFSFLTRPQRRQK